MLETKPLFALQCLRSRLEIHAVAQSPRSLDPSALHSFFKQTTVKRFRSQKNNQPEHAGICGNSPTGLPTNPLYLRRCHTRAAQTKSETARFPPLVLLAGHRPSRAAHGLTVCKRPDLEIGRVYAYVYGFGVVPFNLLQKCFETAHTDSRAADVPCAKLGFSAPWFPPATAVFLAFFLFLPSPSSVATSTSLFVCNYTTAVFEDVREHRPWLCPSIWRVQGLEGLHRR